MFMVCGQHIDSTTHGRTEHSIKMRRKQLNNIIYSKCLKVFKLHFIWQCMCEQCAQIVSEWVHTNNDLKWCRAYYQKFKNQLDHIKTEPHKQSKNKTNVKQQQQQQKKCKTKREKENYLLHTNTRQATTSLHFL